MFAMVDVSATGLGGAAYARDLLARGGVAVMPGCSFGETMRDWVRVALTVDDARLDQGCDRIAAHARLLKEEAA